MEPWRREVVELHEFFERYFLGTIPAHDTDRVEVALAPGFTMCGPTGVVSSRAETVAAIMSGHGHTSSLSIATSGHRLIAESPDLTVAAYVESHELTDRANHRMTTVVFGRSGRAPNGLEWLHAQETWIDRGVS